MNYRMQGTLKVPYMALGCMRIGDMSAGDVQKLVETSLEEGINYFDHADIYGGGNSERVFGEMLKNAPELRDRMLIQTKCSIVPGVMYDFSKKHIIDSVDGSLSRLGTDHIDVLLLHRPDAIADYEELASAFEDLTASGKVGGFGVSNMGIMQMELMKKLAGVPIMFNQIQMSIVHCPSIDAGFNANVKDAPFYEDILNYCAVNDIGVQAWSVVRESYDKPCFIDNPSYDRLNEVMDRLAVKYDVTKSAIAIAWLLRHPAGIMPVLGSTNPDRVRQMAKASDVRLEKSEWYELYMAAGKNLP